jgi:single-strand DNA-binding protein
MGGSVNKVILVGHLGADPEIRRTQDGRGIANLRIATSETWRDKNTGERRERTEWHRVVIFADGLVKVVEQYVKKGARVYIEGQLQTRKWQDQQGQDRWSTEVVLQGFNSQFVMLDKTGGGPGMGVGGEFDDGGASDYSAYGSGSGGGSYGGGGSNNGSFGGGGGNGGSYGGGNGNGNSAGRSQPAPARQPAMASGGPRDDMNDEVPF